MDRRSFVETLALLAGSTLLGHIPRGDTTSPAPAVATRAAQPIIGIQAAFAGGAHGVLLSRKYSEMRLANLRAAGRAVRAVRQA